MKTKFVVLCLIAIAFGQFFTRTAGHPVLYWFVTLPGTFMHEVLHYLSALALQGHPEGFTIMPSGTTLGSVAFVVNWYNAASVALAPILLMPISILHITYAATCKTIGSMLGWTYVSSLPLAFTLLGFISFLAACGIKLRLMIK